MDFDFPPKAKKHLWTASVDSPHLETSRVFTFLNMTLELLRLLEFSDVSSKKRLDGIALRKLYDYSVKNRMASPLLQRVAGSGKFPIF